MRYVTLGSTDLTVSEFGFGGIPLIRLDVEEAVDVLRYAHDRGITFFDTANMYMDSEEKMGRALSGVRSRCVLASKTMQREGAKALEELELSLIRLKTDYIDLYQLHNISQDPELDAIAARGGVLEALAGAKKDGKIRYIGVSSHNPQLAAKLVETGLFATLQFPFNFVESEPANGLIDTVAQAGMGFIAMKPFGGGVLDNASLSFKFLRLHPQAIPIPGLDSMAHVDEIAEIYAAPNEVSAEDERQMDLQRAELGREFCRRCQYCQPCPNGVRITFAMMYPFAALRLSPAKAVGFAAETMASVRECTQCGECEQKCPYGLPIARMLEENLRLYDAHRAMVGKTC